MEQITNTEDSINVFKNKKVVILWYGQIWQWFYEMLKKNWISNVFVISERKNLKWIFSQWDNLPIDIPEIDYIINTYKSPDVERTTKKIPNWFSWKIIYIQNGFDIKEKARSLGIDNSIFWVLNMSIKRQEDWKLKTSYAWSSPIYWEGAEDFSMLFNKEWKIFENIEDFEKAKNLKWIVNCVFNSLCVLYNLPAKKAIDKYSIEKTNRLVKEIVDVINHENNGKINFDEAFNNILEAYENFANDYPSTHQDFYELKNNDYVLREKTLKHELDSLIWFIVKKAKEHKIEIPFTRNIYNKIKKMEKNSPL